jgi:LacI family transcriptional regulator
VQHLVDVGKKNILFAGGPIGIEQIADRLKGAERAVSKNKGVQLETFVTKNLTVLEGRALGDEILSRPKSKRPDAIFAANDLLALGIMQAIVVSKEVSIPKDIAIVGYDDISYASTAIISLTSIRQPSMLIGAQAVELLLQETENPGSAKGRQVVFQPELVVRDTTSKI